jgi:hypothetical protein
MKTTKHGNKLFLMGMMVMLLVFGSVLSGCATIKVDEGSLKTISVESKDLADVGVKMGYTEKRVDLLGYFPGGSPLYPKAQYCTFTTTVKKIKRDGIWIRSSVDTSTYSAGYYLKIGDKSEWQDIGTFSDKNQANAAATSAKIQHPEWAGIIQVKTTESRTILEYIGFKPL